jgi:RNA polymerase sigma-70 factor (ECF subfamily)
MSALRNGDDQVAWERFVRIYTPFIYYWARQAGLQPADAADLVQDVFALLVRKLPEFRYDSGKSFRGWLRTVTLNKWRENNRRRVLTYNKAASQQLETLPSNDDVEASWDREYSSQLVRNALGELEPQTDPAVWSMFWQHAVCGRPAADVARALGVRLWQVYGAKARILRQLREYLGDALSE